MWTFDEEPGGSPAPAYMSSTVYKDVSKNQGPPYGRQNGRDLILGTPRHGPQFMETAV